MKKFNYIAVMVMLIVGLTGLAFASSDGHSGGNGGNHKGSGTPLVSGHATVDGSEIYNAGADASNTNLFEAGKRAYPIQGNVNLPALPGYFGDNNRPGHQFISLDKLMMYNTVWEIKAEYPLAHGQNLRITPHNEKVAKEDRTKTITCTKNIFDKNVVDVDLLAVGAINSTNKKVISSDLLDNVLAEASEYGATHIQFLAEGTNTELSTSGWGIGINYTKAGDSSVATGGTGFSTGWAGYSNLPWQQFFFLKITDKNATADITAPVTEEEVVGSTQIETNDTVIKNETIQ